MVEKVLFSGKIFEREILMDLHNLRAHESENHIFSGWSLSLGMFDISIIQKEIITETLRVDKT